MARIRSIHPGQANDVDFTECSMPARLLAILLRNFADDNGVFVWREKQIKMDCFPADSIDVGPLLQELIANKQVKRFTKEGIDYGIFRNFRRWQRPEKPKTIYPIDDELIEYSGQSPASRRPVADQSPKSSADGKELYTEPEPDKGNGKERIRTNAREVEKTIEGKPDDPPHWAEVQDYLKTHADNLTDWDIDFLHSVKWRETLTPAQSESLKAIRGKLKSPAITGQEVFIVKNGTPEFAAWIAHDKAKGLKTAFKENLREMTVPSLFPPELEKAA